MRNKREEGVSEINRKMKEETDGGEGQVNYIGKVTNENNKKKKKEKRQAKETSK